MDIGELELTDGTKCWDFSETIMNSIKEEGFLDQLSTYGLLKTHSAPWSQIRILLKELLFHPPPNKTCTHDREDSAGFRHGSCIYS
jgi:hypothetical protein